MNYLDPTLRFITRDNNNPDVIIFIPNGQGEYHKFKLSYQHVVVSKVETTAIVEVIYYNENDNEIYSETHALIEGDGYGINIMAPISMGSSHREGYHVTASKILYCADGVRQGQVTFRFEKLNPISEDGIFRKECYDRYHVAVA